MGKNYIRISKRRLLQNTILSAVLLQNMVLNHVVNGSFFHGALINKGMERNTFDVKALMLPMPKVNVCDLVDSFVLPRGL